MLLDALLDAAVDAVIIADAEGRMTRVNEAACAMFGYSSDDMIGATVDKLIPDPESARHGAAIARHIATGETTIIGKGRDLEGMRNDGSIFPLHISVGRSEVGGEVMFVGVLHDLTHRKATEGALVMAQRMEALGQLTGGVAHDFNNILTVIVGNLELLEPLLAGGRETSLLHEALDAAEIAAALIGKLLALGRKTPTAAAPIDLHDTMGATFSLLERTLGPKIHLRSAFAKDVWMVEADPAQLQTALINLAVNARDAMPDGGEIVFKTSNVRIDDDYITQEVDIALGDYVRLSVTDNGQGMAPDIARRAFEPFFTTKAPGRGTGLGLSTVYALARQSGGHATLYSEPMLGTTVSLYFRAAGDAPHRPPPLSDPSDAAPAGHGETILIVEDDEPIRRLSVDRIEAMGYHTLTASDAEAALAVLAEHPEVAALFTDIVMDGPLNGIQLAEKVRAERPEIAILLTSGFSADLFQPQDNLSTNFQLLHKPYRQSELATRLRILLSGKHVNTG